MKKLILAIAAALSLGGTAKGTDTKTYTPSPEIKQF